MDKRQIRDGIFWMGAVDWDRRLFDSLVPLPDGTTYNAYLIEGSEKTALLDAVDPAMAEVLFHQLRDTRRIDYIVSHHTEQDHSGTIPLLLERYPEAQVLATAKGTSTWISMNSFGSNSSRAICRSARNWEMNLTSTIKPASAMSLATSATRRMFSTRSSAVKPRSRLSPWRTLSPSSR